uniref:NADH-ubiquinone oxidoreductase chain 2 n=1 Tax=Phoronis psammophila TaxID=67897 RepID=Q6UKG1_9BILA|nr:NADH dehydrogenase subunit 2 [Phoronis architecta]
MNFLPIMSTFFFLLCFSIFFSLSSSHWLGVWLGLELNMLSFIVLMMSSENLSASESSIKYFLLQALGSGLFFTGCIFSYLFNGLWGVGLILNKESLLIMCGLGIKLGSAPFHFWVPSVMNALSWSNSLLLSSFQKIIPLMFLINLYSYSASLVVILMGALGALVGGAGGLNQTQIRSLLGYSSISHVGWVVSISLISLYFSVFYFMIYLVSVLVVFIFLIKLDINSMKAFQVSVSETVLNKGIFFLALLSLAGLPPLLGFFPKMVGMMLMVEGNFLLLVLFLILGSVMSLFYYLNLFFSSYIISTMESKQCNVFMIPSNTSLSSSLTILLFTGLLLLNMFFM